MLARVTVEMLLRTGLRVSEYTSCAPLLGPARSQAHLHEATHVRLQLRAVPFQQPSGRAGDAGFPSELVVAFGLVAARTLLPARGAANNHQQAVTQRLMAAGDWPGLSRGRAGACACAARPARAGRRQPSRPATPRPCSRAPGGGTPRQR